MTKDYLLFGWRVRANIKLPCCELPFAGEPDCQITFLSPFESPQPILPEFATLLETDGIQSVWRIDQNTWRIEMFDPNTKQWLQINFRQAGKKIEVMFTKNTITENILPMLLTRLFTTILWNSGQVCLHGGVVNTKQGGILLLGDSGLGKSSTLTALWQQGCAVLSDDIAVFEPNIPLVVHIGPRYLRLHDDSATALSINPATLPTIFQPAELAGNKRYINLEQEACPESVKVQQIFILAGRENIKKTNLTRLVPQVAVSELLKYRFRGQQLEPKIYPQLLNVCVALAHQCHVYLVHTPANLEKLPEIAQTILEQALV
jgi:hypothetical protein